MDQIACAVSGTVAIDFADTANPIVKKINFDLETLGYTLCVVNTGGSHADLTADYASIPSEMKAVAAFFGKSVLRELDKETVLSRAAELRKKLGDRALLRSLHFFDENARVDVMTAALVKMENAETGSAEKKEAFNLYLDLVNESGDSSWKILQNVYSPGNTADQGITTALALTRDFFHRQKTQGSNCQGNFCHASRVHGGGFAGTIQVYIPTDAIDAYHASMEAVFGAGCVTELKIIHREMSN
jgi:galactokinase